MAVVDRPHLDLDRPALVLEPGLAESGHAQSNKATSRSGEGRSRPRFGRRRARLGSDAAQRSLGGRAGAVRREVRVLGDRRHLAGAGAVTSAGRDELDAGAVAGRRRGRRLLPCATTGSAPWRSSSERRLPRPRRSAGWSEHDQDHGSGAIQTDAVIIVTRVKMSPALVPKALEPPMPPKAPASPPPLPRWIRTRQIRKSEIRTSSELKMLCQRCPRPESFARV